MKKRGRHDPISEEDKKRIAKLIKTNSLTRVAEIMNRHPGSISRVLRVNKEGVVKEGFFDYDKSMYA